MNHGISIEHILIKCDIISAINLSKNLIQHSKTKHIDIIYHFLCAHAQCGDILLELVNTNN